VRRARKEIKMSEHATKISQNIMILSRTRIGFEFPFR
jgi:hypothetical protein